MPSAAGARAPVDALADPPQLPFGGVAVTDGAEAAEILGRPRELRDGAVAIARRGKRLAGHRAREGSVEERSGALGVAD
ncbi:MAG TPA: hypothetical protein VF533_16755 [Solirubrobacteraceae bacterium]